MRFSIAKASKPLCMIEARGISEAAATILANYLKSMTGATFEVNQEAVEGDRIKFVIVETYGHNGFAYAIQDSESGKTLTFEAENEQAFIYAVYDFLERIGGCRYFTSTVEYIPEMTELTVEVEPYAVRPKIEYREIYYQDFEDKQFAQKHKCAQSKVHEGWGFWCHSFQELLPNATYFEAHPEYFALIEDKREPKGEPCLSHPEVRQIMIENLKKFMAEKPECRYWSVSQNDDDLYCRCEKCQAIDAHDESPMGSVLNFVNEVAKAFPDKVISTLSYWYTRKPPKHTRPAPNVHIMTCNIEANRGMPIASDPNCKESKEEMEFWASISENVSLWDYNIQFRNLVSPFPNLRTLQPNMQFFVKNNLKLLFSQCNREIGGEFSELRGYLLAKLAWDPDCDIQKHMEEFCHGYYKEAAPYILKYIELLHDAQDQYNKRLDIFGGPQDAKDTFLTHELFEAYIRLFEQARTSVAYDEAVRLRVEIASLPVDYAGIVLKYGSEEERIKRIIHFAKIARASQLHMVEEWKITVDQFVTDSLVELD